jgi:hypothetical protein
MTGKVFFILSARRYWIATRLVPWTMPALKNRAAMLEAIVTMGYSPRPQPA